MTALLEALAAIEGQIARLDEQLQELARRNNPSPLQIGVLPNDVRGGSSADHEHRWAP